MSSDETSQRSEPRPLQFDTAEPTGRAGGAATALPCTSCGAEISSSYYEANGSIVCASCRAKLHAQFTGGSGSARFAKAVAFGLVAAAAGAALFYAIVRLTGYWISLVAIVVGFLVGAAVRRGSQGRGGRAYQVLAVALTYLAIMGTYIPSIVEHAIPFIVEDGRETPPAVAADSTGRLTTPDSVAVASSAATAEQQGAPTESIASNASEEHSRKRPKAIRFIYSVAALLWLAARMPFLDGAQNIVGLLIIGIALFEAWRQNQKLELVVTGPYHVGVKGRGAPEAEPTRG